METETVRKPEPQFTDIDQDRMRSIDDVIAQLQRTREQFGNTCVYIRRFGCTWGAVALNYRDEDRKNGVFDLQAKYEAMLAQRAEQVQRLIAERDEWRQRVWDADAARVT